MWFQIDADGIKIKLQINGYKPTSKENWDSEWCRCDLFLSSGEWLNYSKEDDEILLCSEIDGLVENLTELLNNEISEEKELACIESDFIFELYPQTDLRKDSKCIYVAPGHEILDIYLEWRIFFWNEGLTGNYLTITLCRDEIELLRDYLVLVQNS